MKPDPGTPNAVHLTVDGQPVDAQPGQTVAAVMLANGRTSWRTTRVAGRPRGVFCGIGACYDCLVVINGIPDIRACQRTITEGDTITTQQGAVLPHPIASEQAMGEDGAGDLSAGGERGAAVPAEGERRVGPEPAEGEPAAGDLSAVGERGAGAEPPVRASGAGAESAGGEDEAAAERAGGRASVGAGAGRVRAARADGSGGPGRADVVGTAGSSAPASRSVPSAGSARLLTVADVVVVGAGPAGIAAALAAADAGVEVLLVDSARGVGGQFNRQPAEELGVRPGWLQHGWKGFVGKRDRLAAHPRITVLAETSVWAFEQGQRLWVQRGPADGVGREVFAVEAKAVVLATGAYDRVLPFPGWDLPGVYSAGAAQALAKGQRTAVGKRVLVAGTGPFLLPVAESLIGVGAKVVGLLEANSLKTVRKGWTTDPLVAVGKLREGLGYGALLARHRIPLRHGWTVVAAHGTERVEAVTIARVDAGWRRVAGTERTVAVDAVCLGFGFTAQLELAVSARCELTTGPDGGPAVVVDANQQTTTPGVYAAGELTGIGGADLAAAEGRVAGAAAAQHAAAPTSPPLCAPLAHETAPTVEISCTKSADVARGRRFAAALAKAYPVRDGWRSWSGPDTVVCRCEEVTRGDIEEAVVERGVTDGRALKLTSRAGLGLCQGRVCSRTVADLTTQNDVLRLSGEGDVRRSADQDDVRQPLGPDDVAGSLMRRPIAVPVRLRDLAEGQEEL